MAEWLESAPCNTRLPSSNPAQAPLQKSNLFEITLVAEDHEPNIGIVCQPLIGLGLVLSTQGMGETLLLWVEKKSLNTYFREKKWRGSR